MISGKKEILKEIFIYEKIGVLAISTSLQFTIFMCVCHLEAERARGSLVTWDLPMGFSTKSNLNLTKLDDS